MTELQKALQHLIGLMDPYREAWKAHCWAEAQRLAQESPQDYADLPRLLKEAMQPASSSSGDVCTLADSSSADVS